MAATHGVGHMDAITSASGHALHEKVEVVDCPDGGVNAGGIDALEAEMNAAFEKELAEDGDGDGEVAEEVQPARNGKGWLR